MNELLKAAQDNLAIIEVRLRSSENKLSNHLRPEQVTDLSLSSQSFSGVQAIAAGVGHNEAPAEPSSATIYLYTFRYSAGVRLIEDDEAESNESSEDGGGDEGAAAVEVKATFDAEYYSEVELEQDCLKEFAQTNVGYHVWPYWRELVQSAAGRMGLKSGVLAVPFYFVPTRQQRQTDS